MTACPECFKELPKTEIAFRCTSGQCRERPDDFHGKNRGFDISLPPVMVAQSTEGRFPSAIPCSGCHEYANQEVCPECAYDLPQGWRSARTFTIAVGGARGAGKTVYIGVLIDVLRRYAERNGRIMNAYTTGTRDQYDLNYFEPLFKHNQPPMGTPPQADGGSAYQRDALIWHVSEGQGSPNIFICIRDMAGEDLERAVGVSNAFGYVREADLVIFMFDPTVLPNIPRVLKGITPDVDATRLGKSAAEVLPTVLQLMNGGKGVLALAVGKFDALHHLPKGNNSYAVTMANPAAHFSRDDTMFRPTGNPKAAIQSFEEDSQFLDAEISGLLEQLNESSLSNQAREAQSNNRIRAYRHFAVSAVGEPPQHSDELTERGISPFRVLDPLLWGLTTRELWI